MIVTLATVVEFLKHLLYICVNIHSPWQQYYNIQQNPVQFSAFGYGWMESDRREVNWTSGVVSMIVLFRILMPLYLRKIYTVHGSNSLLYCFQYSAFGCGWVVSD